MPTFGNILTRKGGTAMTGKVKPLMAIPNPRTEAQRRDGGGTSSAGQPRRTKSAAFRAADTPRVQVRQDRRGDGQPSTAPSIKDRRALRFLCESMRDAADARKFFVEATKVNDFRDVIIAEQIRLLLSEYDQLILERIRQKSAQSKALLEMKAGARDFSERPGLAVKLLASTLPQWFGRPAHRIS